MWCDAQILNNPIDYDYIANRLGQTECDQMISYGFSRIMTVRSLKLEGFAEEAIEILRQNENIPEKRLSKYSNGLEENLSSAAEHVTHCKAPRRLKEVAREAAEVSEELNITNQTIKDKNQEDKKRKKSF